MAKHTNFNYQMDQTPSPFHDKKFRFGRMFPALLPCLDHSSQTESELMEMANAMVFSEDMRNDLILSGILGDSDNPSGYTYLGQFLGHDISFDLSSINDTPRDLEYSLNFRSSALGLESIYGGGPALNPYFYERRSNYTGFWIDEIKSVNPSDPSFYDLPRTRTNDRSAIIADLRNDENIVISQIHCAFLQLHNLLSYKYSSKNAKFISEIERKNLFKLVYQELKWIYQWIILYDFLPRIIDLYAWNKTDINKAVNTIDKEFDISENHVQRDTRKLIKAIGTGKIAKKFYNWHNEPFIPVEFSAAAFRFGHSQVRDVYQFNRDPSSNESKKVNVSRFPPLPLFDPLRTNPLRVDLNLFFPDDEKSSVRNKLIGPRLSPSLTHVPIETLQPNSIDSNLILPDTSKNRIPSQRINLAWINLKRGMLLNLPSGQMVANEMSIEPLTIEYSKFPNRFRNNTPLWYYILYEAAAKNHGKRLGPIGSIIVGEVIIGLIQSDETSFLNQQPNWIPTDETGQTNPNFRMHNLLKLLSTS